MTDELVEHYKARAKGGVGLFVTEVVTVEPTYVYLPGDMSIHDDSFIEGWKKLVDGVHEYGAKILPQLFHPAYMAFPIPGTPQLIAPSHVGPYYAKEAPRPVTKDELKVIIRQFGEAAYRVKQAGRAGPGLSRACGRFEKVAYRLRPQSARGAQGRGVRGGGSYRRIQGRGVRTRA